MVAPGRAGVLGLQGSAEPHLQRLRELGEDPVEVRRPHQLEGLSHLILPGGESTTHHHLMQLFGLWSDIQERFHRGRLALFGTCAGAILLGRDQGRPPPRLDLLDATFDRNAYGRQVDSFSRDLCLEGLGAPSFHCVFIRAPIITAVGPEVEILGRHRNHPILIRGPGLLAATFHPELTRDSRIHRLFLQMELRSAIGHRPSSGASRHSASSRLMASSSSSGLKPNGPRPPE